MKHALLATAALLCVGFVSACATGGATAKVDKGPQYTDVRIWEIARVETAYPDGMLSGIVTRTFDEEGNQVSEETYSGTKTLVSRKSFSSGADGTVAIVSFGDSGDVLGKATRTTRGTLILTENQTNPKGEFQASEEYSYDDRGNKTRWVVKTASGSQVITEYAYELGRLSTITVRDGSGSVIKRFVKVFPEVKPPAASGVSAGGNAKQKAKDAAKAKEEADRAAKAAAAEAANAKPVAEEEYDGAGTLISKTLLTWDGNNLAKEEKKNAFGATLSSTTYKNDDAGNPVEILYADRNGRTIEIKRQQWTSFIRQVRVK